MKKIILPVFCFLLCIKNQNVIAQSTHEVDSRKIIDKAIEFHDNKKYDEAISEFKKVSRNDTNYVLSVTELLNTYIASDKDSLALALANSVLDLPSSYVPNIMVYKGNALDNLKRSDEAIKVYEEGMKKFPLNYSWTYEMGILKSRQEKYKESYDWFVKSIKVNPYHANTHFQLGLLEAKQGKLIPAMLAWQFYLLIDNSSERAQNIVGALEQMAKNEYDFGTIVNVEALNNQDDFSEVETLVKSKVALGNKYKSETKLSFNITKQIQLMFEKLEVSKEDEGFFMKFYTPFFKELYKKKFLEPYSFSILAGMQNKEVDGWMKKNTAKVEALSTWVVDYMGSSVCTYEEMLNGQKIKAQHYYSNGNKILAVGNKNVKGENIGYWNYYYSNGILKSEGAYNDKGLRTGIWKFYFITGLTKTSENYVDGNVDGMIENYYSNGSIKQNKNYSKNLLEGTQTTYFATGVKSYMYNYKANIENGKQTKFHENGKINYEMNVLNGKFEGELVEYFMDGHLKQKSTFKDDNRIGKYSLFYDVPENTIQQEANYEKGIPVGLYNSYFQNGNVEETGSYNKSGEKDGLWKTYTEDKILVEEHTYNNGKNSGSAKYYSNKGKLIEEYIYKNNLLQEYKAYDKEGKTVYANKKDGKNNYDATLYYPNGNKKREGRVEDGQLDGKWKNYNINGYLASDENYKAGKRDGKFYYYYENGKIKSETQYVDGETDGFYKEYYKNGELKSEGAYIKDKEIGVWNTYYADGTNKTINFYKDGNYDNWQQYYYANGKLEDEDYIELSYVRKRLDYDSLGKISQESVLDKGTGVLDIKYKNGKPNWKCTYKDNLKQGAYTSYYPNGKPKSIKTYKDNELDGESKTYFSSGKIAQEQTYLNGDLTGKSTSYFFENGNIKSVYNYLYGKETGKSYVYYPNKQVQYEYSYKNNELEGATNLYNESGELVITKNYEENIFVSYQYIDKTGNLCAPIEVKNETGTIKSFYKSGQISMEYILKNGAIEGKRILYFADGKVSEESNFICDEREGKRTFYYPNGKIKSVENWSSDDKNGACIYYHENGKIKSTENYINDNLSGENKKYDETGKLIKTNFYYDGELIDEK